MERSSFLYKIRRKCQSMASNFISDKILCVIYSKIILKKYINLDNPKTFNEKIQWLKINEYPSNSLVVKCADKYKVREYIIEKKLKNLLVPLIDDWDDVNKINWSKLPNAFVLKCNHGCAYNIVCTDKSNLNINESKKNLAEWMTEDFGSFNIERHYSKIKPHIICEQYLGENLTDYKFFCFNGEPKFMYVSTNLVNDREASIGHFYLDGTKIPLIRDDYNDISTIILPSFYKDMLSSAKILCKDFIFVRVDFILANDRYYFSELTFTPGAGMMLFNPDKYDDEWGGFLNLCV